MKNITLAVDEATLDQVREYAAKRRTSVNALVRLHLEQIARNENRAKRAMMELRAMSDRSKAELGPITWTRDAVHER